MYRGTRQTPDNPPTLELAKELGSDLAKRKLVPQGRSARSLVVVVVELDPTVFITKLHHIADVFCRRFR